VHGLLSGGCGDSSAKRKFPSDKVYRRNDRGIVGVESLSLQRLAFFDIHTGVGRAAQSHGSQGTESHATHHGGMCSHHGGVC
jgi:hypothetical protein